MRSRRFVLWLIPFVFGIFFIIISTRIWNSDGLRVAGLTLFIGVGGNIWATYLVKWTDERLKTGEPVVLLALSVLLPLASVSLYRSTAQRARLVENNHILRKTVATLAPDYVNAVNPAPREDANQSAELLQFQTWIEDSKDSGGVVDDPDYHLGMISFQQKQWQSASTFLNDYVNRGPRDSHKLGLAHYALATILREQARQSAGDSACTSLINAYREMQAAAVIVPTEPRYEAARNDLAHDVLAAKCRPSNLDEVQHFAAAASDPASVPEADHTMVLNPQSWRLVTWFRKGGIARYELPLGAIPPDSALNSILVQVNSPEGHILHAQPNLPFGVARDRQQEPSLRNNESTVYEFFFPRFNPSLGWYLSVDLENVEHNGKEPLRPDLVTKVGFVRFP